MYFSSPSLRHHNHRAILINVYALPLPVFRGLPVIWCGFHTVGNNRTKDASASRLVFCGNFGSVRFCNLANLRACSRFDSVKTKKKTRHCAAFKCACVCDRLNLLGLDEFWEGKRRRKNPLFLLHDSAVKFAIAKEKKKSAASLGQTPQYIKNSYCSDRDSLPCWKSFG